MPRLPRVNIKGALYYITCRSEHQEKVFKEEGDYQMFLGLLKKYKDQYGFKLFAYALLPDHLHLLMEISDSGVSEIMHGLNSNYTKYFNAKYERKGHLFRERFKAAIVEKEPYLPKLTVYIHRNPQKLNLVLKPQDYLYSSCCFYINNGSKTGPMDLSAEINEALGYLKDKNYLEVLNMFAQDEAQSLHKNLHRGGILGSDEFVRKVREEIEQSRKEQEPEIRQGSSPYLLKAVSLAFGIILVSAGVFYFLRIQGKEAQNTQEPGQAPTNTGIRSLQDLNDTEWEISMRPVSGGAESSDIFVFDEGKFLSAKLHSLSYPASNYSVSIDNSGKIIWETMQTGPNGTASWRGEIDKDKMRGMLSLRQEGKEPQDFSFISQGYARRLK